MRRSGVADHAVKRLQYDDVCGGQLISESHPLPHIKKSSKSETSKPLLIPELEDVKYNTYKIALIVTFDGIIFVR